MIDGGTLLVLAVVALLVYAVVPPVRRAVNRRAAALRRRPPAVAVEAAPDDAAIEQETRKTARELRERLGYPDPDELAHEPVLDAAAARLARPEVTADTVVRLSRDDDTYVTCIALAALELREDVPEQWTSAAVRRLRRAEYAERYFLLRALQRRASTPVIGAALSQLDENFPYDWIGRFVRERIEGGEVVDEDTFRKNVPIKLAPLVAELLDHQEDGLPPDVRETFERWRLSLVDVEFLRKFGTVWERPFDHPPAQLVGRRAELVAQIVEAIDSTPPRSMLLVGEHGVGKTALVRAALDRAEVDLVAFEASAGALNAGAMYVGELEGRVEELAGKLKGQKTVWVFPAFEEALYAGQHSRSPQGLLDSLLPHVEAGELTILGEVSPPAYEALLKERPRVASAFTAIRVRALDERDTVAVARHALESDGRDVRASDQVLAESFELAQQFLPSAAPPGNLLRLLAAATADVAEDGGDLTTGDVLATLAAASGLPLSMLDPTARLDVGALRSFFDERVLGQPDAVECVVERITMIKAGLTDATRPLGVFLFVGPTGTGKTEIAKALAEFLFGSPSRMVRLDMSEFQTPESLERLLSDAGEGARSPLLSSVRRDPFSVVLLDEFEKAATPIWDLFLQVFDDGRLTDLQGRTVDFRRCVIVLTANVGSSIAGESRLGFERSPEQFRPETIERAVRRQFRPEFLNRLDRVVVFRPFERPQMRALLDKELAAVLTRRGLRTRPWAVEFDEAALDFLLDQGFTRDLGARPLKRAIERHLLAPLAHAIVEQTVPEGDQFLFVSAPHGRRIEVRFVDPDADGEPDAEPVPRDGDRSLDVRALAIAPRGDAQAASFLLDELARVVAAIRADELRMRKETALDAVGRDGFWDDETRFTVLAEAEYLDRLEAALRTAEKLGERLRRRNARTATGAGELAALLAQRLYVLDRALAGLADGVPADVFVRVRAAAGSSAREAAEFTARLEAMYTGWGTLRGMRVDALTGGDPRVLAVSGLGAGTILADEAGLHVLELHEPRAEGESIVRVNAAVQVAPWLPGPEADADALLALAVRALDARPATNAVVRRYRPEPSPLVRDAVRRYRTGRLDRVLAGDFDLF